MINEIKNNNNDLLQEMFSNLSHRIDDIHSIGLLQSLLNGYPYIPVTTFSLRPFCLNVILNDILINQRKNIVEFGSGISTMLIGRLIKKNNLNTTVISFEHSEEWYHLMERMIANEQLNNVIKIVYAPLRESEFSGFSSWYDPEILLRNTGDAKFDLVIVDGPPAWEKGKEKARFPAIPFVNSRLANNFCLLLDDADRKGEQQVLQLWEKQFGYKFSLVGGRLAYYGKDSFEPRPFWPLTV